jgi:hypothetical protein
MDEAKAGPDSPESGGPSKPHLSNEGLSRSPIDEAVLRRSTPIEGLDPHDHQALIGIDHWQDIQLKKSYAKWLLILVAAQLFVADAVFVAYAWAGYHWHLDAGVVQVWLASTLVELIGVALVITRYLFPRRDAVAPTEA